MPSMMDDQCQKCGKRFGWCGEVKDRPACPRCGDRVPQAELDAAQAKIDRIWHLMTSNASQTICRDQRVMAGLTLRQAAKQLDVSAQELSDYESGRVVLPESVAARMNVVYCVGG